MFGLSKTLVPSTHMIKLRTSPRQTDRQPNKQTCNQNDRHADKQTAGAYKQTCSQTGRQQTGAQTIRQTDKAQIHACLTMLPSDVPEDNGFCEMSDTADTDCGKIEIQFPLHKNVRRVGCATKINVCAHFLCQTCKTFHRNQ